MICAELHDETDDRSPLSHLHVEKRFAHAKLRVSNCCHAFLAY